MENKIYRFACGTGSNLGKAEHCSYEHVMELTDSEQVRTICQEIASLMEGYWQLSEEQQKQRDARKNQLKKQLPFITVHSQYFDDGRRTNATAHDNGCAMLDIDHEPNPRQLWAQITPQQIQENGIIFACITPSTFGLHIIATRKEHETILEAQERLATLFGIDRNDERFDKSVHDAARFAYISPREYILYGGSQEDMCFASEDEAQQADARKYNTTTTPKNFVFDDNTAKSISPATATDLVYNNGSIDIPYSAIIDELIKLLEPELGAFNKGNRHNYYYALSNQLRYLTKNAPSALIASIPNLSMDDEPEDLSNTVNSVCAKPLYETMPSKLADAIANAADAIAAATPQYSPVDNLPIPRLPRLLALLTSHLTDPEYVAATIIASLPVLGAEATGIRFPYYYNQKLTALSFQSILVGDSGIGKSTPYELALRLASPFREASNIALAEENAHREEMRISASTERKAKEPKTPIRYYVGAITKAALLKNAAKANNRHLLVVSDEIATLTEDDSSLKPGNGLWRKMFDNEEIGKYCASADASNGAAYLYCNLLTATQTDALLDDFDYKSVTKGSALRCLFTYLSRQHEAVIKDFTADEIKEIHDTAKALMSIPQGTIIHYEWLDHAINQWREDKLKAYKVGTLDINGENILARTPMMALRAGYLYSLLFAPELAAAHNEEQKDQIKQDCINLMLWTAEYIYSVQYHLFGGILAAQRKKAIRNNVQAVEQQQQVHYVRQNRIKDLLDTLPAQFDEEQFRQAAEQFDNRTVTLDQARGRLSQYSGNSKTKQLFLRKLGNGQYAKIS